MSKNCTELCKSEHMNILTVSMINLKEKNKRVKEHRFITKMVKRMRILGLLPFHHKDIILV